MKLHGSVLWFAAAAACSAQSLAPLPQGNTGIGSRYPNDAGIAADSAVVYADDFESYSSAAGLDANWNGGVYHDVRIGSGPGNVYAGAKSVEFYAPQQSIEWSNTVARELGTSGELDVLFLRYYTKFAGSFDVSGSSHNGGGMSAHYFVNGNATPGIPADGTNKFLAEFESWRGDSTEPSPGQLNVYIYHPAQRSQWGDHWFPNGDVMPNTSIPGDFGTEFVSRPLVTSELDRWHCCELMVKANTPGSRDGRVACWLDGVLIADFPNLRLRDVASLKISRFNLSLHCGTNTRGETWKWYDNVVAAKSYIGPMTLPGAVQPRVGFSLAKPASGATHIYTVQGRAVGRTLAERLLADGHGAVLVTSGQAGSPAAAGVFVDQR